MRAEDVGHAVDRVLLAHAAEIELHSGTSQEDRAVAHGHSAMVHEREERRELVVVGNPRFPKIPSAPQHADRGIEPALREPRQLERGFDQSDRLVVDGDRRTAGVARDLRDDALVAEARELALDAEGLVLRGSRDALRTPPAAVLDEPDDRRATHQGEARRVEGPLAHELNTARRFRWSP